MICPKCGKLMEHRLRFEPLKSGECYVCKNCFYETSFKAIKFNDQKVIQDNKKQKTKTKNSTLKKKRKRKK